MSILIVACLLSIWIYFGWLALGFAQIEDHIVRGFLAPAVGMAIVTLTTTTTSLAGLPANQSRWIVLLMLAGSLLIVRRTGWSGFRQIAGFHAFLLLLNLCSAALGLVVFGASWQGLINEDGATNSLAAQYFMTHAFFAVPDAQSIASGLDYSPLSSMLFVAGGSRFGDVMLLGLSASLFNLNPDEVYMAHGLAIRCAMIASAVLLLYRPGARSWKLVVAGVLLTLSPLTIYSYTNQLISQMGGFTLVLTAALLFQALVDRHDTFSRLMWPLAVVITALIQTYPESISFLAFLLVLYGIYRERQGTLPPIKDIAKAGALLSLLVLAGLNVSLPNVISHMLGSMGSVAAAQELDLSKAIFRYAFTPDFLPLLFGFRHLGEGVGEPLAFALQLSAGALAGVLVIVCVRRFESYPLLIVSCGAAVIAFSFLSWQRNEFGTFKMMLFAQPLLFCVIAALMIELMVARHLLGLLLGFGLLVLVGRGASGYVLRSLSLFNAVPQLAKIKTLDKIQGMVSSSTAGVIIDSPYYLYGKFAVLRPKARPLVFEQNISRSFASAALKHILTNSLSPWRPNQDAFWAKLEPFYDQRYETNDFQCAPPGKRATFDTLIDKEGLRELPVLMPGGQLAPLNRRRFADDIIVLLDRPSLEGVLAFRPSSLGPYFDRGTAGIFDMERDPLAHSAMAGVGRYVLLESHSPAGEDFRLAVRFSRTYLGADDTRLQQITLYGANAVSLETVGAGALSLTSLPLQPCNIGGRSFILVDFGSEPKPIKKVVPWLYQTFNVPYVPDIRRLTGFLRDISVVPATTKEDGRSQFATLDGKWDFEAFESSFEYSGMFEDGWISERVLLRPKPGVQGRKFSIGLDIPVELAQQHSVLNIEVDGVPVSSQPLSAGPLDLQIDLSATAGQTITLSSDRPLVLPGRDGRSVIGHLRSITAK